MCRAARKDRVAFFHSERLTDGWKGMKLAVVNRSENEPKTYSSTLRTQMARSFEMFVCLSHYTATYSRKRLEKLFVKITKWTALFLFETVCMFYQPSLISFNVVLKCMSLKSAIILVFITSHHPPALLSSCILQGGSNMCYILHSDITWEIVVFDCVCM